MLLHWHVEPFVVPANYLHLDATEQVAESHSRRAISLTPRHSAGLVGMWEQHDRGRIGVELYYTGEQSLSDNPYRRTSKLYLHVGFLGEMNPAGLKLFLNLENILGIRQTRTDPLLHQPRTPFGVWTVDAWAPLEGFIANTGVREKL